MSPAWHNSDLIFSQYLALQCALYSTFEPQPPLPHSQLSVLSTFPDQIQRSQVTRKKARHTKTGEKAGLSNLPSITARKRVPFPRAACSCAEHQHSPCSPHESQLLLSLRQGYYGELPLPLHAAGSFPEQVHPVHATKQGSCGKKQDVTTWANNIQL